MSHRESHASVLQSAVQHHQAGRLAEAEKLYRLVLSVEPANPDALHLLGVIAHQVGQHSLALQLINQAAAFAPEDAGILANLGEVHRHLGSLGEAESCLRRSLAVQPDAPGTLNNLALVLETTSRSEEAFIFCRKAIAVNPELAEGHNTLGDLHKARGEWDEAARCFQRAIALNPNFAEAHNNLGVVHLRNESFADAIGSFEKAIAAQPNLAEAHYNLATALTHQDRIRMAEASARRALTLKPNFAEAYHALGEALLRQVRLDEASAAFREAIRSRPDYADAHVSLGAVLQEQRNFEPALACFQRALELNPNLAAAHSNLGNLLREGGLLDRALIHLQRALQLKPGDSATLNNLGELFKERGELAAAVAHFRQALAISPENSVIRSNLILTLHYASGDKPACIQEELARWDAIHAKPLATRFPTHANDPAPERPLRIGYVSPDFRSHPVAQFLLPLFARHDPKRYQLYGYSNTVCTDGMTERLRSFASGWHDIAGVPGDQVADLIRADQIDILVDLAVHTARNRLLVFARKPALVQMTYLGYPGDTGLSTMDYRITDVHMDPVADAGPTRARPLRLPETYWCYSAPSAPLPPSGELPALRHGYLTFGCLNNFCKVTPEALATWALVLSRVPASRLILHCRPGRQRDYALGVFRQYAVDPERIEFVDRAPMADYFQRYTTIDIGLDSFPFPGGTTTCDSLWMGVPVITLAGPTPVTRGGVSLLHNVALTELIACSTAEYIEIAQRLAADLPRLASIRASLRMKMQQSPLMDAPRFCRALEGLYRSAWRQWCTTQPSRCATS